MMTSFAYLSVHMLCFEAWTQIQCREIRGIHAVLPVVQASSENCLEQVCVRIKCPVFSLQVFILTPADPSL